MLILVEAYVKNFYTKIMNIFYPPATPLLVHYVSLGDPDPIIQPPSLPPPPMGNPGYGPALHISWNSHVLYSTHWLK